VGAVADRTLVLAREREEPGRILAQGATGNLLRDGGVLERGGIPEPDFVRLESALRARGYLASASARSDLTLLDLVARGTSPAASI
jgi:hypothetical protein